MSQGVQIALSGQYDDLKIIRQKITIGKSRLARAVQVFQNGSTLVNYTLRFILLLLYFHCSTKQVSLVTQNTIS